jgi:hypothetical protein
MDRNEASVLTYVVKQKISIKTGFPFSTKASKTKLPNYPAQVCFCIRRLCQLGLYQTKLVTHAALGSSLPAIQRLTGLS